MAWPSKKKSKSSNFRWVCLSNGFPNVFQTNQKHINKHTNYNLNQYHAGWLFGMKNEKYKK